MPAFFATMLRFADRFAQRNESLPKSPADTISSMLRPVDANHTAGEHCALCKDELVSAVTTPCNHIYCNSCIRSALSHRDICPLCTRKLFDPLDAYGIDPAEDMPDTRINALIWFTIGASISCTADILCVQLIWPPTGTTHQHTVQLAVKVLTALACAPVVEALTCWTRNSTSCLTNITTAVARVMLVSFAGITAYAEDEDTIVGLAICLTGAIWVPVVAIMLWELWLEKRFREWQEL